MGASCGTSPNSLANSPGESRSGSARIRSSVIVRAPAAFKASMMAASLVRGQGHWPTLASEGSSMSTMRTGSVSSSGRGATLR